MRAALALLVLLAACAGTRLETRTAAVDEQIALARANGAIRCAPVELAMAESHNDFAKQELAEGNFYRAKSELAIAEVNARDAVERSPKDVCNPEDKPPEKVAEGPKDTDGDGLYDDKDECPRKAEDKDGFQDEDGCPEEDNDADGIADKIDDCPLEPEDRDGTDDTDGCPDLDNDKDGIADKIDQCPDDPEDADGFEDDDGCPDCDDDQDGVLECPEALDKCPGEKGDGADGCKKYQLVTVTEDKIELSQTVYFDTNKAVIKKVSFALLDDVARALEDNPTIKVRIEGHTDSQNTNKFNLKLSQKRADAVRKYLIKKGIAKDRMVAKGFGEEVPIADNRTKDGRAQNRRVEFYITER
jgi:outer membrane protein OmpA-like peptidoglycan-associated protein